MDKHAFDLWLQEAGLQVVTMPLAPVPAEVVVSSTAATLPPVAELELADLEEDDEDTDTASGLVQPGDRLENTELVAAVFHAAGNPRYEDVRLKTAWSGNCRIPTYREIAVQRAKRVNSSVAW